VICVPWVLVFKVEPTTIDEPKIMYEGVFEGDENVMLVWSAILDVRHYRSL